jgi:hypothetical protein
VFRSFRPARQDPGLGRARELEQEYGAVLCFFTGLQDGVDAVVLHWLCCACPGTHVLLIIELLRAAAASAPWMRPLNAFCLASRWGLRVFLFLLALPAARFFIFSHFDSVPVDSSSHQGWIARRPRAIALMH